MRRKVEEEVVADVSEERVFILRLWRAEEGDWQASLKDVTSKEPHYFGSVDTLIRFLAEGLRDRSAVAERTR